MRGSSPRQRGFKSLVTNEHAMEGTEGRADPLRPPSLEAEGPSQVRWRGHYGDQEDRLGLLEEGRSSGRQV